MDASKELDRRDFCAFAAAGGAALGAMSLMRGVAKADGGAADD